MTGANAKIKRILVRQNGVEKQVRPVWKPGANTIAYYPFSDNGNDYSGNGYNLTSTGATNYTTIGGVKSANFSGSNYLFNSSLTTSTIGQTFTVSFWGYSSSQLGITSMKRVSNQYQGWGVYLETGVLGRIRGEVQYNHTPTRIMPSITYQEGWHHIVFTHNSSNGMSISYDGEVKATGTGAMGTTGGYLVVGAFLDNTTDYFNGNVSELILENKVRTADEISNYYNLTKANYLI